MTNIEKDIRYITYKATSNMLDNPEKNRKFEEDNPRGNAILGGDHSS